MAEAQFTVPRSPTFIRREVAPTAGPERPEPGQKPLQWDLPNREAGRQEFELVHMPSAAALQPDVISEVCSVGHFAYRVYHDVKKGSL